MSYIRTLPNGKFRAEVSKNYTSIQSKTFSTHKQATKWATDVESNIAIILELKPKERARNNFPISNLSFCPRLGDLIRCVE